MKRLSLERMGIITGSWGIINVSWGTKSEDKSEEVMKFGWMFVILQLTFEINKYTK